MVHAIRQRFEKRLHANRVFGAAECGKDSHTQQSLRDGIIGEGHGIAPLVVIFEPDLGLAGRGLLQRRFPAPQHGIQRFGIGEEHNTR